MITKDTLFRPLSKAESKAETTHNTALAIIEAEARSREAKTERLRKARLEMEAKQASEPKALTPAKPRKPRAKRAG
jgi:hypothetical protein